MTIGSISAIVVAILHYVFGLAESVGWAKMSKGFGYSKEQTKTTASLALNQGAYNAGFATLLLWAVFTANTATVIALLIFIVAMAVVGGVSVKPTIFAVQGVPALIALGLNLM